MQKLPLIDLLVTAKCFLECPICYTPSDSGLADASLDDFKKVLDILAELGVTYTNISGGEPLLRKDIADIVSHSAENGIGVYLATTGKGLIGEKYERLKNNLIWLGLSLDGSVAEVSHAMKGFPQQPGLVGSILDYFNNNSPSHGVRIGTVVSAVNKHDIDNIGQLVIRNGEGYVPDVWKLYQFCERGPRQRDIEKYRISEQDFLAVADPVKENFKDRVNVDVNRSSRMTGAYMLVLPNLDIAVPGSTSYKTVGSLKGQNVTYLRNLIYNLQTQNVLELENSSQNRAWIAEKNLSLVRN